MAHALKTKRGMWVLYHGQTGQRIERWPVDARGMIECGEYTTTPPEDAEPVEAPSPEDEGVVRTEGGTVPGALAERRSRLMAEWNQQQKMTPEAYLGRWPDGPNADLAREIVTLDAERATASVLNSPVVATTDDSAVDGEG